MASIGCCLPDVLLSLAAAAVLQRMDFSRDSTTAVLQRPAPPLSLSLQLRPSIAVVRQSAIVILCALDHDEPNVVVAVAAGSDKLPLGTVFTASNFLLPPSVYAQDRLLLL